jgi:acyl carrier protein
MILDHDTLIACIKANAGEPDAIGAETPLFSSGLLDSVAMLNLIMFIEQQTGIEVRSEDVTLENFDTSSRILFYAQKAAA